MGFGTWDVSKMATYNMVDAISRSTVQVNTVNNGIQTGKLYIILIQLNVILFGLLAGA